MKLQEAALICSAIAALLHLNTLDCGFCFDDESAIIENSDLQPDTSWTKLLQNDFWGAPMSDSTSHKSYRPLTVATFRLNYMLHELQPLGYHLVNVLLHSAVCYLYVLLCGVVFSEVWPALIAGLLFAVHPIHTEAVAGLVGRAELLCSIFYILSVFCYHRATNTQSRTKGILWLSAMLVSTLCSTLSKEQGLTSVGICLIYDLLYNLKVDLTALLHLKFRMKVCKEDCAGKNRHFSANSGLVTGFIERVVVLAGFSVLFLVFRFAVMGGSMPSFYFEETNPAAMEPTPYRQLSWLHLCFVNIWLLLNPSNLCADWANGTVPLVLSVTDLRNLATVAIFVAIFILSLVALQREKTPTLLALSLLVLPYLPASNLFFPVGFVVAERVLYLPSMGFCMLVTSVYNGLMAKKKSAGFIQNFVKVTIISVLLIQSLKTVRRNRDWYNEETLWKSAITVNPMNAKVFTNFAKVFDRRNEIEKALALSEHALELQPGVMMQWVNVAFAHKSLGHLQEAEKYLRGALTLVPEGKKMSFMVGHRTVNVYGELGDVIKMNESRLMEAARLFKKAVSLETTPSMQAHWKMVMGDCFIKLNDFDSALSEFISANSLTPDSVKTNHNLAVVYGQAKQLSEAERYLRRALEVDENHVSSISALATILGDLNDSARQEEALLLHERASRIDPTNFRHQWRKGDLHTRRGEFAAAKSSFKQALTLDPSNVKVLYSIGKMYSDQGRYGSAVEVLEKVAAVAPSSLKTARLLAGVYRKIGRTERAEELEKRINDTIKSGQ